MAEIHRFFERRSSARMISLCSGCGAGRARRMTAFTLIELVTSMTVGVIICGIAASLIWNASRQRAETAARSELMEVGSAALEVMLRYLREIPQDAALLGEAQVDVAAATELRFDGGIVGFRLDGGANTLEMTNDSGANWHPLAKDVSGLTFSYFQGDGSGLTSLPLSLVDRQSVRRISLQVQLDRSSQSALLRTSIYLRNFMNEG
jgi:type II secretory pathway pseudopilin PulG